MYIEYICYIRNGHALQVMAGLPIILSLIVMLFFNLYSWWLILTTLKNLIPVYQEGALDPLVGSNSIEASMGWRWSLTNIIRELKLCVNAAKRLDPITHNTVFRLLCTPIVYIVIIVIPTVIVQSSGYQEYTYTVALCSMISTGTINFISWVLVDGEAMRDLCGFSYEKLWTSRESNSSTHSHRPRSEDNGVDAVGQQIAYCRTDDSFD